MENIKNSHWIKLLISLVIFIYLIYGLITVINYLFI